MSIYQARTMNILNNGKPTWVSPNDDSDNAPRIVAHRIVMDVNGKENTLETYSDAIAQQGWQGMVEIYEKNKRFYVRQAPKDNFNASNPAQGLSSYNNKTTPSIPKATTGFTDNSHTMYTAYAKDIAVALIAASAGEWHDARYREIMDDVSEAGIRLYQCRPGGKVISKQQSEPEFASTPPPDLDEFMNEEGHQDNGRY